MSKAVLGFRTAKSTSYRAFRLVTTAAVALAIYSCYQIARTAAEPANLLDEPGEWLADAKELGKYSVNHIGRSLRLRGAAMKLGAIVFDQHCASCHGADLKGLPKAHTPDLTDAEWRFSGDDFESGGLKKFPSDVEWTVRYGIRTDNENARGNEVNMLAYFPEYRSKEDTEDFGDKKYLTDDEIADVVEYVLQLGGQQHDQAKATRGDSLFHDNTKGNCFDCHGDDGSGIDTFGSSNLTKPRLYLYGSDRASISESIIKGRRGFMPSFEDKLTDEELKAVSIFVFSSAALK
jgi:cytochrome c oxidase cbb3-type subunit 3